MSDDSEWYQCKRDWAGFVIMLLLIFFTGYRHDMDDTDVYKFMMAVLGSFFICQKHYWKWMPIAIFCIPSVAILSSIVFKGHGSPYLLNYEVQDFIIEWLSDEVAFFITSMFCFYAIFMMRESVIERRKRN